MTLVCPEFRKYKRLLAELECFELNNRTSTNIDKWEKLKNMKLLMRYWWNWCDRHSGLACDQTL